MQIDPTADRAMICAIAGPANRAPRRVWPQIVPAVMELAGGDAALVRHADRNWASVTFSGSRHTLVLAFAGPEAILAGERFIAALPDHEFAIPRQLVADATVVAVDHALLPAPKLTVEVELLLLEEA